MAAVNMKAEYHLLGTYTRYSSWTARVATIFEYFGIPYTSTFIKLRDVKTESPSGTVPLLTVKLPNDGTEFQVNDSLAICEFLAESHPELGLWPKDLVLRALARSVVAEMHAGFGELRNTYHTNFIAKYTGKIPITEKGRKEIERMLVLWGDARKITAERLKLLGEEDVGFLFGGFGIADSFFWPVLWRFRSYDLPLETATPQALVWMKKMWNEPVLKGLGRDYYRQAERSETLIEKYDDVFKGNEDVEYGKFEEDWEFEN